MPKEKLLLIPGPSPVHRRILEALAEPTVTHVGPEMQVELKESCENLKKIVFCEKGESFLIAGAGTLAMEIALLNTAAKEDRILDRPADDLLQDPPGEEIARQGREEQNSDHANHHAPEFLEMFPEGHLAVLRPEGALQVLPEWSHSAGLSP